MISRIPSSDKKFYQTNRSTLLGNIWSTFNIDLQSNLGALRVSPRLKVNTSTATQASLGVPVAIKEFDTKIFAICNTKIFVANTPDSVFTEDASSNFQAGYSKDRSDLELFNGTLVASLSTGRIYSKEANDSGTGAWSQRGAALGAFNHSLTTFPKFNRLYVTASTATRIHSFNTSWTEAVASSGDDYSIDVDPSGTKYHITTIKASAKSIFIGTMNKVFKGGKGAILEWDGLSDTIANTYDLDANGCMAIVIKNERVFAIDSNGVFLEFTGYTFKEIGRLPFNSFMPWNPNDADNERFIHPNGLLLTENNTLLAFVDNRNYKGLGTANENFPSGVWELDLATGSCTHKYSLSYNPMASSTITDYGQNRLSRVGAIASVNIPTNSTTNGKIMLGAEYFTDATTTQSAIFIDDTNDTVQKYGYFVTPKIFSQNLREMWQKVFLKFSSFASPDEITVKYRMVESAPTEATITWTTTSSFNTTTNIGAYVVGDEVEVIQGTGSGLTSHITSIQTTDSGYMVNLDKTYTGATGTAKARLQKWRKIPDTFNGSDDYVELGIGDPSSWIQLKVCMLATGQKDFYELILIGDPDQKLN